MIGRADIEGSKSNVAMNAWLPQAGYPCGNFSTPLASNSEGHTALSFNGCAAPAKLPTDNVFRRIGRREAGLGSKKRGDAPPPFHGISKITLKAAVRRPGKVPEGTLPVRPPAGTRRPALAAGAARAVHRQPTGSGPGPPCPALEPILFPRLRIHFADFPCLHCSIDRRLFTLETRCGYEYDRA
ncbi:unnamed protein product [Prunus brigantina]